MLLRSTVTLSPSLLAAGCLDAPPEYSVPEQIPPIIPAGQVVPSLEKVYEIRAGQEFQKFNVPFRSRDLDDPLSAYLYRFDSATAFTDLVAVQPNILPRDEPLADQDRVVDLTWTFTDGLQGCQRLTFILSHNNNFVTTDEGPVPDDELRAARITWWFNFSPGSTLFSDCLSSQQEGP